MSTLFQASAKLSWSEADALVPTKKAAIWAAKQQTKLLKHQWYTDASFTFQQSCQDGHLNVLLALGSHAEDRDLRKHIAFNTEICIDPVLALPLAIVHYACIDGLSLGQKVPLKGFGSQDWATC